MIVINKLNESQEICSAGSELIYLINALRFDFELESMNKKFMPENPNKWI